MPSYLIVTSARHKTGAAVDAILCDPGVAGYPARRTGVPVKATISERTLTIDDEPRPRAIISCVGENGTTTYLVDGSTSRIRNRERRAALAQASGLLHQLRSCLQPLTATSAAPEPIAESLQQIYDWIRDEREQIT